MKLYQVYQTIGGLLWFWRTKMPLPAPPSHTTPFDDLVRGLKSIRDPAVVGGLKQGMTDQEFKKLIAAMDARYDSLKQGEALRKLSTDELRELRAMETDCGLSYYLTYQNQPERLGRRAWHSPFSANKKPPKGGFFIAYCSSIGACFKTCQPQRSP